MNQRRWVSAASALGLAAMLALFGCVVVPDQGHYVGGVVMVAPPPAREEIVAEGPAGAVWISGYWNWVGGRYEWVNGSWLPGRPGYHWVAHHWARQGDGWRMRPGHWARG
jgi:hypothetical protein